MTMVTIGVTVRGGEAGRTEVVVDRPTTVEAVVAALNAVVFLCPVELRATALKQVLRLAETGPRDPRLLSAVGGADAASAG